MVDPEVKEKEFEIKFKPDEFGETIIKSLKKFHNNPLFSDVTLIVNGERIPAHKAVLSGVCPKLQKLLSVDTKSSELVITLDKKENVEAFKLMLTYIYTGNCQIVNEFVLPVMALALEYGVKPLIESCGTAIGPVVRNDNLFYYLDIAKKFDCQSLMSSCGTFLANNFEELLKQDILFNLPIQTWIETLKKDEIKIRSETEIYHAVLRYANQFSGKERIDALEKLFPHVRFYCLPPKFLAENVETDKTLEGVSCLQDLVFEAYRSKFDAKRMKNKPRRKYGVTYWRFAKHDVYGIGNGLVIEEDGLKLSKGNLGGQHTCCVGDTVFDSGVHYWEFEILLFTSGINIGIIQSDSIFTTNYVGSTNTSWDYCNTGTKINVASLAYGQSYGQGDRIGVLLDLVDYGLYYFKNDTNMGLAYSLPRGKSFVPAVSLYGNSAIRLREGVALPDSWK